MINKNALFSRRLLRRAARARTRGARARGGGNGRADGGKRRNVVRLFWQFVELAVAIL